MKTLIILTTITIFTFALQACGTSSEYQVGASPTPHAEILEQANKHIDEAYQFEIVEFSDYVLPNTALHEGDLIANFFQHTPYLENQIDEHGYDFESVGGIHIEPIGLYSKQYDDLSDLPSELEIIVSNSPSDRPRLLGVLEDAALIELSEDVEDSDIIAANIGDLESFFDSEFDIEFVEIDPTQLYTNYNNESGDLVLINGNFALDHGLNPLEDALALESSDSPYANVLVTLSDNVDDDFIQALYEVLKSDEISEWIEQEYGGSVILAD